MDWGTIRPALQTLIAGLSDVPGLAVTWLDQPRPFIDPSASTSAPVVGTRAQVFLAIKQVASQGLDACTTSFLGFTSSVVAGVFQGLPTAQQVANTPLWFTENAPAPFALNTQYFAVAISGAAFSLAATPSGSAITPTLSASSGAVLSWAAPGTELVDTYEGIRLFVLELRAESFEQTDGMTAHQYLEEVRQRLYRKSSEIALLAINVAWYADDETQDLEVSGNDRAASVAILRLHMRAAVSEADLAGAYGYVTSVTTTGP